MSQYKADKLPSSEADNLCKAHFILNRYGVSLCNFHHTYLVQNLIIFDQNSINSFESETYVHAYYYALFYALYTDYITIPSVCVLSPKEFVFADTLIILLAHGLYA
jgi:hypothetical protein